MRYIPLFDQLVSASPRIIDQKEVYNLHLLHGRGSGLTFVVITMYSKLLIFIVNRVKSVLIDNKDVK